MGTTSRQRQATYRARIKERGLKRVIVNLDGRTLTTLRQLAKDHGKTQAEVIQLGILAANKWLSEGSDHE